jgi:predicted 3-demethylubiquinone-9 3-methyltransferase (glyoxalase superfamily)
MMENPTNPLSTCLWFDNQAENVADFYLSVFEHSKINHIAKYGKEGFEVHGQKEGTVMAVSFELEGQKFLALNGGPVFKTNPSISFFITCESKEEVNRFHQALSQDGMVMMPLDKYDWSEWYCFIEDRFGVSWQIYLGNMNDVGQKIVPSMMFPKINPGNAEHAIRFYTSIFKNTPPDIRFYPENDINGNSGNVMHAQFKLGNQVFMAMDSGIPQKFTFSPGISFVITCQNQNEIDYFWERLTEGGYEPAQQCGWLEDKFGVSWQVVPAILEKMMSHPDHTKKEKVTKAFLQMKKFVISDLEKAFES